MPFCTIVKKTNATSGFRMETHLVLPRKKENTYLI